MYTRPDRTVATIMSWPVATIDHRATLAEAAESLAANDIGALLVLRDHSLVGIVSERDVVQHVGAGTDLTHLLVGEVMSGELVTVALDATILSAARLMSTADVRHLPVLQEGLIAGLLSMRDVVSVLALAIGDDDVVVLQSRARVVVRGA